MTHELKKIVSAYLKAKASGMQSVLATVVALDGSSYRRPGVRMLILENDEMIGAVSGGCVEKEVLRQADSVFKTSTAKVMTYDGRFRLGCEGILYVLLETFEPSDAMLAAFQESIRARTPIRMESYYEKEAQEGAGFGTKIELQGESFHINDTAELDHQATRFVQELPACYRLMIVGSEHDAVQLCSFASGMGWEVTVIAHPTEEKQITDFPGATDLQGVIAEQLDVSAIDEQTAIVLMTHSYVKDLQFLIALQKSTPIYLGLLGPNQRREKLLNEFLEYCPEVADAFFDRVHGPAGLNIGGETPQEIAIAILAEILAVIRGKEPMSLRDKNGGIHA